MSVEPKIYRDFKSQYLAHSFITIHKGLEDDDVCKHDSDIGLDSWSRENYKSFEFCAGPWGTGYSNAVEVNGRNYIVSARSYCGGECSDYSLILKDIRGKKLIEVHFNKDGSISGQWKDYTKLTLLKSAVRMATGNDVSIFVDQPYSWMFLGFRVYSSTEPREVSEI